MLHLRSLDTPGIGEGIVIILWKHVILTGVIQISQAIFNVYMFVATFSSLDWNFVNNKNCKPQNNTI